MERSLRLFEDGQEMIARRRLLGGHPQETAASVPPRSPRARGAPVVGTSASGQEARRRREESVLGNMYERETMQLPPSWRERRRRRSGTR